MIRRILPVSCALAVTGCNDSRLVDAPRPGCEQAAQIRDAVPSFPRGPRPISGAGRAAPAAAAFAAASADDLLRAMDVDPSGAQTSLIGHPNAVAVFHGLGALHPSEGSTFAWLSTGVAGAGTSSAVAEAAYGTQDGTDMGAPGCDGAETFDCVQLRYRFQAPAGAHSIRFDFNFLSTEFPEYVNAGYNDRFTVSLESPSRNYGNITFDQNGSPIGIDSVFFDEPCTELTGTGFDLNDFGYCDAGATGRLTTVAPIEPGETVTLTFTLMDAGDGIYDSAVMIDRLHASAEEIQGPQTNDCD